MWSQSLGSFLANVVPCHHETRRVLQPPRSSQQHHLHDSTGHAPNRFNNAMLLSFARCGPSAFTPSSPIPFPAITDNHVFIHVRPTMNTHASTHVQDPTLSFWSDSPGVDPVPSRLTRRCCYLGNACIGEQLLASPHRHTHFVPCRDRHLTPPAVAMLATADTVQVRAVEGDVCLVQAVTIQGAVTVQNDVNKRTLQSQPLHPGEAPHSSPKRMTRNHDRMTGTPSDRRTVYVKPFADSGWRSSALPTANSPTFRAMKRQTASCRS